MSASTDEPGPRLLIFDFDGTLVDSVAPIVANFQHALAACGLPPVAPESVRRGIGLHLVDVVRGALPGADAPTVERVAEAYRAAWTTVGEPAIEPFPGIFDLLDRCRARGDRLAIATGKSRRGLDRAIARWDLLHWFEATRTVDCVLHGKPAPDMVVSLLDALGVPARRATVIGDTAWDLRMAHGAGARAIACTWGAHGPDTLRGEQPLAVVETLAELDALLQAGA